MEIEEHLKDTTVEISPLEKLFSDPEFVQVHMKNAVPIIFEKNQNIRNNSVVFRREVNVLANEDLHQAFPESIISTFQEMLSENHLNCYPLSIQIVARKFAAQE
jgi:hypothetical protein